MSSKLVMVFRPLSDREASPDELLIIGAGPVGRLTGEDLIKQRKGQVLGFLSFADERQPAQLPAPFLGSVGDLEAILRTMSVSDMKSSAL